MVVYLLYKISINRSRNIQIRNSNVVGLKDIINQTTTPNTTQSLKNEFMNLGIKSGDVIIVHSSLSKMGWTIGGPVAVIDALMSVVSKNTENNVDRRF